MSDQDQKIQSKRPHDGAFKQQKLKAWQPLLTPWQVIGTFAAIGAIFLALGGVCYAASESVVEIQTPAYQAMNFNDTIVGFEIEIQEDMSAPVYFYYKLHKFHQNHRRYVKSRSDPQLRGLQGQTADCDPLEDWEVDGEAKTLYPCGLIAHSKFNDTFSADICDDNGCRPLHWNSTGIAWASDMDKKFKYRALNPEEETAVGPSGFPVWTSDDDEEFVVWMRTAGLPTFTKLHRIIHQDLKKGQTLSLNISNVFPVASFGGKKSLVLTTMSWLGGKNSFLGIAYFVVGGAAMLLALIFLIKHVVAPRPLGDLNYLAAKSGVASR